MTTVAAVDNPLLAAFNEAGGEDPEISVRALLDNTEARFRLAKTYSFAIPDERAIRKLVELSPVVEIGAGSGYWASLVRAAGGDIVAYDDGSWASVEHSRWFPVVRGDHRQVIHHPDRTLFLCWPPYNDPMAYEALRRYKGERVVYVGEGSEGCTGDAAFHDLLHRVWELEEEFAIPRWPRIYDGMFVYARKRRRAR